MPSSRKAAGDTIGETFAGATVTGFLGRFGVTRARVEGDRPTPKSHRPRDTLDVLGALCSGGLEGHDPPGGAIFPDWPALG